MKPFVTTVSRAFSRGAIKNRHTEPPAALLLLGFEVRTARRGR
jgi:hypothetical protein